MSDNTHERSVGTIGDTEVKIVAEGQKAKWCADVISNKIAGTFVDIKNDVEQFTNE